MIENTYNDAIQERTELPNDWIRYITFHNFAEIYSKTLR